MKAQQENKNQNIGLFVSLGVHVLLLLCFYFISAWKEPDPPIPDYGIELNFGLSDRGSGQIQPAQPVKVVNTTQPEESAAPESLFVYFGFRTCPLEIVFQK